MADEVPTNTELDTRVTAVNPKGRGGWVAVTVALLVGFEGLTNLHGGYSVGTHQSFDPRGVNTVCYGHIEDVQIGDKYTKIQCEEMLAKDLPRYEAMLERCITVPMPGYRHGAILSFTYNIGGGVPAKNGHPARGGLCGSSVAKYINAGEISKGCDALLLYDKSAGKVLPGLVKRRQSERKLCYNGTEPPLPDSEVMKLPHMNVDQATADREAKAIVIPKKGTSVPKVSTPAPAEAPHVVPTTGSRVYNWLMEK